jgi:hypothetical protein
MNRSGSVVDKEMSWLDSILVDEGVKRKVPISDGYADGTLVGEKVEEFNNVVDRAEESGILL